MVGFPLAALSTQKQGAQEAVIPLAYPKWRVFDLFAMETLLRVIYVYKQTELEGHKMGPLQKHGTSLGRFVPDKEGSRPAGF